MKPWGTATRTAGIVSGTGNEDERDTLLAGQTPLLLNIYVE